MRKSERHSVLPDVMRATTHQGRSSAHRCSLGSLQTHALLQVQLPLSSPIPGYSLLQISCSKENKTNSSRQPLPLPLLPDPSFCDYFQTFSESRLLTSPIIGYIVASKIPFKTHLSQEAFPDCNSTLLFYYLVSLSRCALHFSSEELAAL